MKIPEWEKNMNSQCQEKKILLIYIPKLLFQGIQFIEDGGLFRPHV